MRDWKRYEEAKRLRETGLSFKAVGAALGVSGCRARDMVILLDREESVIENEAKSPRDLLWHGELSPKTAAMLRNRGFDSREACAVFLLDDHLTIWRGSVALPGWEADKRDWRGSAKNFSLAQVNEIRAWLGAPPYFPQPRIADPADIERARRLLESNGWHVEPPTPAS